MVTKGDKGEDHPVINASLVIRVDIGRRIVRKGEVREEVDPLKEEMLIEEKVGALFVKERDI